MTKPVRFERTYDATVEELWELWTTREGFEAWWGPEGFRAEVHELDLRVGGVLRYDMIADTPEMIAFMTESYGGPSHAVRAVLTEVVPLERLAIRSAIDFLPGVEPYDNTITVHFSRGPDGARMVIEIEPHRDEQMTGMASQGMESQLTKVEAALAARRA